jgi:putative membrane protein
VSERAFFLPDAKARAAAAVQAVEAQTCAEVVVTVRKASRVYRHTDYLVGFLFAVTTLLLLLFLPQEFHLYTIPADVLVAFAAGAVLSANAAPLRRALTSKALLRASAEQAAKAAFVDLGVSRTTGRHGVLVYASFLERAVVVVPDVGIDPNAMGPSWAAAVQALEASVKGTPTVDRFLEALAGLGPPLAKAHPRREDDVNELSDELAA